MSSIQPETVRQAALALRKARDRCIPIAPVSATYGIAGDVVQAHLGALGHVSCRLA